MEKSRIEYYSTNLKAEKVSFSEALLKGLAPDGGLYMPTYIPLLSDKELEDIKASDNYSKIAYTVLRKFLSDEIGNEYLLHLCEDAYNFSVPLERVGSTNSFIMRLDQGPTASFKDFAARMMARLMNHFIEKKREHYTILTATSGDTGSAVASAFQGLDGIDVIILYPAEEVTDMQRKQMTTLTGNIKVIAINGKFDDCQRLVKKAFVDPSFSDRHLSSANSINIGRLLPQSVYYIYAWAKLAKKDEPIIFSVPSGNYGNLMGGIIGREMGLPVSKFIISTNANNGVPKYLASGIYRPIVPSINCISSAMNVGHPSNLARIIALYGGVMDEKGNISKEPDIESIRKDFIALSISDKETKETIKNVYNRYKTILEPHGAVAWKGLTDSVGTDLTDDKLMVSLETAHPFKFKEEIIKLLGLAPDIPMSLKGLDNKPEYLTNMENDYQALKDFIVKN